MNELLLALLLSAIFWSVFYYFYALYIARRSVDRWEARFRSDDGVELLSEILGPVVRPWLVETVDATVELIKKNIPLIIKSYLGGAVTELKHKPEAAAAVELGDWLQEQSTGVQLLAGQVIGRLRAQGGPWEGLLKALGGGDAEAPPRGPPRASAPPQPLRVWSFTRRSNTPPHRSAPRDTNHRAKCLFFLKKTEKFIYYFLYYILYIIFFSMRTRYR